MIGKQQKRMKGIDDFHDNPFILFSSFFIKNNFKGYIFFFSEKEKYFLNSHLNNCFALIREII